MMTLVRNVTKTYIPTLPIVRFDVLQQPLWFEGKPTVAFNEAERTGIEGIAFTPRTISVEEASVILRIMNASEVLPIPVNTAVEEDAADFIRSIQQ